MNIIVTGSLGFMGSHLVDYLHNQGHRVIGIDNMSTGFGSNWNKNAPTMKLDLVKDKDTVAGLIEGFKPDVVYHLAAWAHEGLSQFCPILITENNFNATLNVLNPSIRAGCKRFVFTSSMSVYGEQTPPFDESYPRKPSDIYGVAKSASEQAIEILSQVHGFDYTIVRPHNVYGPRQSLSDPYRNVVGIFMRRALANQPLVVYGDGEQKRAFSYIGDITPVIARAGFEPRASKQIINIGPLEEYTVNQLAEEVVKLAGTGTIEHVPERPLEVAYAYCTNQKAIDILGYSTVVSFTEGLGNMWEWAKALKEKSGIAEPRYLDSLELVSKDTPTTWTQKTL